MPKIIINDNLCRIEDAEADLDFFRYLDEQLSFKVQGAEHTPSYRGYINRDGDIVKWDGQTHLLDSTTLEFPYGLLSRVQDIYTSKEKLVELIDNRRPKTERVPIDILSKLKETGKDPFYYQLDALNASINADRGILKLSTGAGKSLIIALIVASKGKSANVYVIGKSLLYQLYDLFVSLFDCKIGIIGDGKCEIADINIISVWSAGTALGLKLKKTEDDEDEANIESSKYILIREVIKNAKLNIYDECHICSCSTIQDIAKFANPEYIYGLSGTPRRDDGSNLLIESIFGKYLIDISATKLINEGYLVRPTIKFITVPKMRGLGKSFQSIYRRYIVENEIRNGYIINGAEALVNQGYSTLVIFNSIEHGNILYKEISKKVPTILLSGKDSAQTRDDAKAKLESGEIKIILASKIFDIGVDIPKISGLILTGGGKSTIRALQRIGRCIRRYPNKTRAAVIEFHDQAKYLEQHSEERLNIYKTEEGFKIICPKKYQS